MSSTLTIQHLREELKLNCVPIPLGSGKALTTSWTKWQDIVCNDKIDSNQDYAIILGKSSDNVICLDFDHCDDESIVEMVMPDFKNKTLTVKTGNGFHVFVKLDDLPKQATTYLEGKCQLELKSHGSYVIGATSDHYDKVNGKYELSGKRYDIISNAHKITKVHATSEQFIKKLNELGFVKISKPIEISSFDVFALQTKKKGTNRQGLMLSIGVKMVMKNINDYNEDRAIELAKKLNQKLKEPYDDEEQLEKLGKSIWGYANGNIKNNPLKLSNDDYDIVSKILLGKNRFVTVTEDREIWYYDETDKIYKKIGLKIIEEFCQDIIEKCKNHAVNEVVETIKRSKTQISMETLMESRVISALDGVLNPKTFEITDHSPDYLTTTKLPINFNITSCWLRLFSIISTIDDPTTAPSAISQIFET